VTITSPIAIDGQCRSCFSDHNFPCLYGCITDIVFVLTAFVSIQSVKLHTNNKDE